MVENGLGAPLAEKYLEFDPAPLASASIGQVHRARMTVPDGIAQVVVKVQRPDIQQIVDTDLSALRVVIRWVQYYPPIRRRVNAVALMEEFSRSLYEEMDYLAEGKNGETFAANFADDSGICVPRIYWSHTARQVLTQEEIEAIKITDYAAIELAGLNRTEIANRLFDTYLKQIFEDHFFHADPHPGNLFVFPRVEESGGWKLVFVDFGMTGTISAGQLEGLRELLFAVGTQDVARMVRSYQLLGILLPGANIELLEKAGERVFERFWGKSTTEIVSMGHQEAMDFAKEFGELLYELPFQIPENMILLGRCLGILSGICTGLDPEFNVWNLLMPYASRLMEASGGGAGQNLWLKEIGSILQTLIALPRRTDHVLQRIEQGRLEVQVPEMKGLVRRLERTIHQLTGALLFATFIIASVQVYLAGLQDLALIGLGAAFLSLIWMLIGR